ncbi:hypothetical protein CEXT_383701 [Caerostris extrusa]|uniref:Uncharacterized protein n=1 Tax=Caerostris extrusa TaxID=172846 RepID=A0AAV4MT68_CAEEX|nr:hypothetical protein CEXT_383701 [Caerostris extrusa]
MELTRGCLQTMRLQRIYHFQIQNGYFYIERKKSPLMGVHTQKNHTRKTERRSSYNALFVKPFKSAVKGPRLLQCVHRFCFTKQNWNLKIQSSTKDSQSCKLFNSTGATIPNYGSTNKSNRSWQHTLSLIHSNRHDISSVGDIASIQRP